MPQKIDSEGLPVWAVVMDVSHTIGKIKVVVSGKDKDEAMDRATEIICQLDSGDIDFDDVSPIEEPA